MCSKYLFHFLIRVVYYKLSLDKIYNPFKAKPKEHYKLSIDDIKYAFNTFDIKEGDTIIIHSSLSFIDAEPQFLIDFLKEYIGPKGNILMPTHPKLEYDKKTGLMYYDVRNSKSTVGYLTELFRKSKDTLRSNHPFSSVAAWGNDKEYFLENNLNGDNPLPHGIYSPYYKMSRKNGKAIFFGVTPRRATIMHTAEEVLDPSYSMKGFFKEHCILVGKIDGQKENVIVRKADLKMAQIYVSKSKVLNDWKKNDILKTIYFNKVAISYVDCQKAVDLMMLKIQSGDTYYPCAPKRKY